MNRLFGLLGRYREIYQGTLGRMLVTDRGGWTREGAMRGLEVTVWKYFEGEAPEVFGPIG